MSLANAQLITLMACGLFAAYLVIAKRRIDLFTFVGAGLVMFVGPIFFTETLNHRIFGTVRLEVDTVLSLSIFAITIFFATLANDLAYFRRARFPSVCTNSHEQFDRIFTIIFMLAWASFFLILIFQSSIKTLIFSHKTVAGGILGFQSVVFIWLSTMFVAYLLYKKDILQYLLCFLVVLVTLAMGHREPLALGVGAGILARTSMAPRRRLIEIRSLGVIVGGALLVTLVGASKRLYSQFKFFGYDGLVSTLVETNPVALINQGIEWNHNLYIFNSIVAADFSTGGWHIVRAPLSLLPLPQSLYGDSSGGFYRLFQPEIFPAVEFGLGYSPFGEFYAAMGLLGIMVFSLSLGAFLFCVNSLILSSSSSWRPLMALLGIIGGVFIYRLSVGVLFANFRNVLYPFVTIFVISLLTRALIRKRPPITERS